MRHAAELVGSLLAGEIAIGLGVGWVLWRRYHARLAAIGPLPATPPALAPEQPAAGIAVAAPSVLVHEPVVVARVPAFVDFPEEEAEEDVIEDGRSVVPTMMTLVWGQLGQKPARYSVRVDSVSRDTLVFGGEARRLDAIQIVPTRRLFHTMRLPGERLLAAHDADDAPIADMRLWLEGLAEA